jgi:hypothetical protein
MGAVIDWTKINTVADLKNIDDAILYDESEIRDPIDMRHLNPNLTDEEIEDALFWKDFVNGIFLVTGDAGNGKGIVLHMIAYKMKYYFGKRAILDTRPRKAFGEYIPFSNEFLVEQLARMDVLEKGNGIMTNDGRWFANMPETRIEINEKGKEIIINTGKTNQREILLRNSVLGLDEYGNKYMPRKQSNLAISIDLLKLYDIRRHLQCLTLGVGIDINDFNRKALAKTSWEARCKFIQNAEEFNDDDNALIFGVSIRPVSYDPVRDVLAKGEDIAKLRINAKEPKNMLGGKAWKDIFNTQNSQSFDSAVGRQLKRKQQ